MGEVLSFIAYNANQVSRDYEIGMVLFGTTHMYSNAVFGCKGLKETDAYMKAFAYVNNDITQDFVLIGSTGIGKSVACACILNRLSSLVTSQTQSNYCTGYYIKANDLYYAMKGRLNHEYGEIYRLAITKPYLFIDDLGLIKKNDVDDFYTDLIDLMSKRIENGKKTLITANFTINEFQKLPDALLSRLSKAVKYEATGPDLRVI